MYVGDERNGIDHAVGPTVIWPLRLGGEGDSMKKRVKKLVLAKETVKSRW
jgi:hypothetical protein